MTQTPPPPDPQDQARPADADAPPAPPARRALKWTIRLALVLLLGLAVILYALPGILSGGWGRSIVSRSINQQIAGRVQLESISLSWFGGQRVRGLTLLDPDGQTVAEIDELAVAASLWSLATGGRDLGLIEIRQPRVQLVVQPTGQTNLQQAIAAQRPDPAPEDEPFRLPVIGRVELTDGSITVESPDRPRIEVAELTGAVDFRNRGEPIAFQLDARTQQAERAGRIAVNGELAGFGPDGVLQVDRLALDAEAEIRQLPTGLVDALARMRGRLIEAVGPTLDLTLTTAPGEAGPQQVALRIQADRVHAALDAALGEQTLSARGELTFTAAPQLLASLIATTGETGAALDRLQLADDVPVTITLDRLETARQSFDPATTALALRVEVGPGQVTGLPRVNALAWDRARGGIDAERLDRAVAITLDAPLRIDGRPGRLHADARLEHLVSEAGQLQLDRMRIRGSAAADGLPTALADGLLPDPLRASEALGPTVDLALDAAGDEAATDLTLTLAADRLDADLPLRLTDRIALQPEQVGRLTWRPDPATVERLEARYGGMADLALAQPIELTLRRLAIPWPRTDDADAPLFQPAQSTLVATLSTAGIDATLPAPDRRPAATLAIDSLHLELRGEPLSEPRLTLDATVREPAGDDLLARWAARRLTLGLDARTALRDDLTTGPIQLALDVQPDGPGPLGPLTLAGAVDASLTRFEQRQPTTFRYTLDPAVLPADDGRVTLAAAAPLELTLRHLRVPLRDVDLAAVQLDAKLTALQSLALAGDPRLQGLTLDQLAASLQLDGPADTLAASFNAQIRSPRDDRTGDLSADADLRSWRSLLNARRTTGGLDLAALTGQLRLRASALPTTLVARLHDRLAPLPTYLGPDADLDLALTLDPVPQLDASLTSDHAALDLALAPDPDKGNALRLRRPATLRWTLTPDAFAHLLPRADGEPPAMTLAEPAEVTLTLDRLVLPPWPTLQAVARGEPLDEPLDLAAYGLRGELSVGRLVTVQAGRRAVLDQLTGTLDAANLAQPATLTLNGAIALADAPAAEPGRLDAAVTLTDWLTPTGELRFTAATLQPELNVRRLPVAWLDALAGDDDLLASALGQTLDLTLTATLAEGNRRYTLKADAANAGLNVPFTLRDDAVLLTGPAAARFSLTEQLSTTLISHPLLRHAIRSIEPAELTVQPDGFRLPLALLTGDPAQQRHALAELRVDHATLNPRKLIVKNAGVIRTFAELPRTIGRVARLGVGELLQTLGRDELRAWFTPVQLTIRDGVAEYSRMDMLLGDDYQIATWGSLDLVERRGRMIIGPTRHAMREIYGITGLSDDPHYVDQFLMDGRFEDMGIDRQELFARLTLLTVGGTAAQVGGEEVGGLVGDIIGGLGQLDRALNKEKRELEPPPPPYDPLPWQEQLNQTPDADPESAPDAAEPPTQPTQESRRQRDKSEAERILDILLPPSR